MALVEEAVRAAVEVAGWKMPDPGQDGAWRFRLQGGLDVMLFSPDGRSCVIAGEVCSLPAEGPDRIDILNEAARRQVGVCRSRPSILAVEARDWNPAASSSASGDGPRADRLVLYRLVRLEAGQEKTLAVELRDFLNDLDWWRAEPPVGSQRFGFAAPGAAALWMGGLR